MNKTCIGCGVTLQDRNKEELGYTNNLSSFYCERCFRINHYGEYKKVIKDNSEYLKILEEIRKTKDFVLLVVDLFFLNENFSLIKDTLKENPILLVLTKRDLLPKDIYEEKIIDYMKQYEIHPVDTILISSKNYHYDELLEKIKKYQKSDTVYVVGYTNAGKSTMINHLIYHYSNFEKEITTSMLPSTTLNKITIPLLENLKIVDTPGLLENGNIIDFVDIKTYKKILPKKEVHPITYQVKGTNYFSLENLLEVETQNTNVTFFFSNNLKLERTTKGKNLNFKTHTFEISKPTDIVICGLGFIKVTKPTTIKVSTLDGVKVYTRNPLL